MGAGVWVSQTVSVDGRSGGHRGAREASCGIFVTCDMVARATKLAREIAV